MTDEIKKLRQLVREMRLLGIKAYSSADLSISLSDVAPVPQKRKRQGKESISEGKETAADTQLGDIPEFTEEQILFWSAGGE